MLAIVFEESIKLRSLSLFLDYWLFLWMHVIFCQMLFLCVLIWSYDFSFFLFGLLIWWITVIDFEVLNQLFTPGINFTWSWYIIFLYFLGFELKIFSSGFLCLCIWEILICTIPVASLSGVGTGINADLTEWVRKYFLCFCPLEEIVQN